VGHLRIGDFHSLWMAVHTSFAVTFIDEGDTGPRIGKLIGSIVVRSRCVCVCVCACECVCMCVRVYVLDHKIYGRLVVCENVTLNGT
jgi:hypothetical protein